MDSNRFDLSWLPEGLQQTWQYAYAPKLQALVDYCRNNTISVVLFVVFIGLATRTWFSKKKAAKEAGADKQYIEAPDFPEIQSLPKFNWHHENPIKIRNFKPKYHLTMGE